MQMQVGAAMESTVSTNVPAVQNVFHIALDGRVLLAVSSVDTSHAFAKNLPPSPTKSVVAVVLGLSLTIIHLAGAVLASPPQFES